MKVSVVIPAFNVENYISSTIRSCLNQTLKGIEVIIIDDGSSDNTKIIIEDFARDSVRVKAIYKDNGGVTSARAVGIEAAKGEYICFLDGDDTLIENALEIMYNKATQNDLDVVFGDIHVVNEKLEILSKTIYGNSKISSGESWLSWILEKRMGYLFGKIIRKTLIEKVDIRFSTHMDFCEDLINSIQLATVAGKVDKISEPVYNYLKRESSVCHVKVSSAVLKLRYKKIIDALLLLPESHKFQQEHEIVYKRLILFYLNIFIWHNGGYIKGDPTYKDIYLKDFLKNQGVRQFIHNESPKKLILTYTTIFLPSLSSKIYLLFLKYYLKKI